MFAIGDQDWPGISKLIEECGEVVQVCGKLMGTRGEHEHWDGSDLKVRLEEEIADLIAAVEFVCDKNNLDREKIFSCQASNVWCLPFALPNQSEVDDG